jgi:outer membrane protein assembly factor BamB
MKIVTIVLAVIMIVLVMGFTGFLTFTSDTPAKVQTSSDWSYDLPEADSVKVIDLNGDGQDDVFVQNAQGVAILDANGNAFFQREGAVVSTMGDVDGDGVEDVIIAEANSEVVMITALRGDGSTIWNATIPARLQALSRIAVMRFDSGSQIVVGDNDGVLLSVNAQGQQLWQSRLSMGDYIRGLDEARIGGVVHIAAANHNGTVGLFDANGEQIWEYSLGEDLRRLRGYDLNGDGTTELLIGGDQSKLLLFESGQPDPAFSTTVGQAVTQIREGEVDGDPTAREFLVGGKEGGFWAYRLDGTELWSTVLPERVNDIDVADTDGDGQNEVFVGTDNGILAMFTDLSGREQTIKRYPSGVARISAGTLGGNPRVVVATKGDGVQSLAIAREAAPFWYNPLLAGVIISVIIVVVAWFVASIPQRPAPTLETEAIDYSVEGLKAQRMMLHESIADVERLKASGEMPTSAYQARLKELRKQLADNEAALLKAGVEIHAQVSTCPACGGEIEPGQMKCDYCGTVILR